MREYEKLQMAETSAAFQEIGAGYDHVSARARVVTGELPEAELLRAEEALSSAMDRHDETIMAMLTWILSRLAPDGPNEVTELVKAFYEVVGDNLRLRSALVSYLTKLRGDLDLILGQGGGTARQ